MNNNQRTTLCKINREEKVTRIINSLEYIEKDIQSQKFSKKVAKNLKKVEKEFFEFPKEKVKFTTTQMFLLGKHKLSKNGLFAARQKSREYYLQIIKENSSSQKQFLTPELMAKASLKQALKTTKRNFGFINEEFISTEECLESFYHDGLSSKRTVKALKAILYNHNYITSPAKRKNTKTGFLSKKKGFKPVLPKVLEKLSKSPDVEDSNIHKNYQQAIKKSSIELGIFRLKLSKLLHLKDAVDTTKIIA